jgi:serine/threonine protein kinase
VELKNYGEWEPLEPQLGEGGQSVVYLARTPARIAQREKSALVLKKLSGQGLNDIRVAQDFAKATLDLAREDLSSELGALKIFKIRTWGAAAEHRFRSEITVLQQKRHGLPKLLDANEAEQWMVTEYFPGGTLEKSPLKYRGEPRLALNAFRSLVQTVADSLHKDGIVHRDLKPANVFIGNDGRLIPGDFGIAFVPGLAERVTLTHERVGPWDYMPQWADTGDRLEEVKPNFDVYMLGKLLWCMIAGRLRLPREYHRRPEFDLAKIFPNDKNILLINPILDKCLVEYSHQCLASTTELLEAVDEKLAMMDGEVPLLNEGGKLILPCRICGKGFYQDETSPGSVRLQMLSEFSVPQEPIVVRVLVCNVCCHREFFAPNYPEEAAKRGWKPWRAGGTA